VVAVDRRTALVAEVAIGGAPSLVAAYLRRSSHALLRDRLDIPGGVHSGDVTTDSAVLWASATGEGRLRLRPFLGRPDGATSSSGRR